MLPIPALINCLYSLFLNILFLVFTPFVIECDLPLNMRTPRDLMTILIILIFSICIFGLLKPVYAQSTSDADDDYDAITTTTTITPRTDTITTAMVHRLRPLVCPVLRHLSSTRVSPISEKKRALAVYVTCPNETVAKTLARGLLEKRLIACANIIPNVVSMYWWKGSIEEDSEILLMLKTLSENVPELTEYVSQHHPYEVPEVIALNIEQGNPAYLDWIQENVMTQSDNRQNEWH
jgi:periplasmic divalent cation tolerance protein